MKLSIPVAAVTYTKIGNIAVGTMYCRADEHVHKRPLMIKVEKSNGGPSALSLDADTPFEVKSLEDSDLEKYAIPLRVQDLTLLLGSERPDASKMDGPGALMITSTGPILRVVKNGVGAQTTYFYLDLKTWKLSEEKPERSAVFTDWKLVGRDEDGLAIDVIGGP